MKYLILIFVFLIPTLNFAQHEFAPIGAEWYYNKYRSLNPPKFGYTKLTSLKDSVIENKKVRVIEVLDAPNDSTRTIEGYEYLHQSGDTIWYWKGGQFHMLYNFAMQKGDSILLYSEMYNHCSDDPYGWNMVDSTFIKSLNGVDIKSYSLTPINNSVWGFSGTCFEIFGHSGYLIPQNSTGCVYDATGYGGLRCYSDPINGILVSSAPNFKCDSTTTYPLSSPLILNDNNSFCTYPNPVDDILTIKKIDESTNPNNYEMKILTISGEVLESYQSYIQKIDVSHLKKGTYILVLSIKNKTIDYEKFIKL